MIAPQKAAMLAQRPGVRQFVKFGIVGASSTAVSYLIFNIMLLALHQNRYVSETAAFLISVVNGYFWNRRWTFKGAAEKAVHTQFVQFLLVNLVGLGLDLLIIKAVSVPLEHRLGYSVVLSTNIAKLFSTALVAFWNFFANRLWTFKH